ncbi:centromere kinetochore component CENP-T-domain-containing protein [Lasiosphaeris hirsuta]|uniref:Centromere kinetochore component CENP-T-domain-containing protein n=1 Tax=Lasiosphaeris hirsuta TaxID=260670 RepID=A0AA40B8Q3_9PEZI|nr:centromere kinetochore component CENP-T-domain-containing protein [Lasiosphaeris hirsuta]
MARESRPPGTFRPGLGAGTTSTTPIRRASSADPTPSSAHSRHSLVIRTPGSQNRGLSASGRKATAPGPSATPHARAAFRTIDSRRAAISTPHGARRQSLREVRDTPRNLLLPLARMLARGTQVIASSSSPPAGEGSTVMEGVEEKEEEEEEEDLPKRPRLSLPIDVEEDDSDLYPHRSAGLEDENFTMQSIEMPRRAISEQLPGQGGSRFSMGSVRMSDYFAAGGTELRSEDAGIDSGFFPPGMALDGDTGVDEDFPSYERAESDVGRRETLARVSDFGIEVPLDMNESTVVIAPQVQDSPMRQLNEYYDEPALDPRSDDDDRLEEAAAQEANETVLGVEETEMDEATAKISAKRATKKRNVKISRHGIEYPSLPPAVVKRLAQTFAKTSGAKGKINPDTLKAIMQASDWFFEQVGEDLEAYAKHAHRKTIDESDMLTLMKRQRQTSPHMTPFALAQRHLPRELLQELRMTPPVPVKKRRKAGGEAEEEDGD